MELQKKKRARFGAFQFDLRTGELHGPEGTTLLSKQISDLLQLLLEQAGDVATHHEIRNRLWPNVDFMDFEVSTRAAIMKLRNTLQTSRDQRRYIETIPQRGYRLTVPVAWVLDSASVIEDTGWLGVAKASGLALCSLQVSDRGAGEVVLRVRLMKEEEEVVVGT